MASRCTLAGVEVPIIGSDSIKFLDLSVPSSSSSSSSAIAIANYSDANLSDAHTTCAPLAEDFASCATIGDPPTYLIWFFLLSFRILFWWF